MKNAVRTAPKLNREQKTEVVRRLAAFEQPPAIAKAMKEDFGIEITPQAIAFYDPTRSSSSPCPKCWSDLFWQMRAEFIERIADVGAAHRTVRLRWLDQMARAQMEKLNTAEARALLKQAADEMSRITGQKDEASGTDYSKLSDAEREARLAVLAAKLGLVAPSGGGEPGGGEGEQDSPEPAGEPVSG